MAEVFVLYTEELGGSTKLLGVFRNPRLAVAFAKSHRIGSGQHRTPGGRWEDTGASDPMRRVWRWGVTGYYLAQRPLIVTPEDASEAFAPFVARWAERRR